MFHFLLSKQRFNPVFSGPGRRRTSSDDLDVRKGGKRRRNRRSQKSKTVTLGEKLSIDPILEEAHASTLERSMFVVGEDADIEDLDEDVDIEQSSLLEGTSSTEDVLRIWERSLSENNEVDPMSSSSSINQGMDEVDDKVGVLEKPKRKTQSNKVPVLHRAQSVPSLHAKTKLSPGESIDDDKTVSKELHRCTSLHEFLSGKVQKLKEDFKVQSLGRQTDYHDNLERRSASHPTSPVGEENKEKIKLKSTLSDPSSLISDEPVSKESEIEDNGSSPDQTHTAVVHRDAQGVVKSGTVKRQSKNFEEGRVNLPWEWEEALEVLEKSEQDTVKEDTPDCPSTASEELLHPSAEDEPPIGVVKMHAQKFQGTGDNDIKSIDSRQAPISPTSPTTDKGFVQESNRIKDMQGTKERFEKDVQKVNEDMMEEKSRRRLVSTGMSETDKTEDGVIPTTVESQESEKDDNEFLCDRVQSEDPLPGTVRKHTQAIEYKYQQLAQASSVESVEDMSSKRTESENVAELKAKNCKTSKNEVDLDEQKDTESFDVDVLLQRVNEDMQKEREERRESGGFTDYCSFSLKESMFEDIKPQTENTDVLQEQDDESEIPRPGTVRRNTELLLGKGIATQDKTEKSSSKDDTVVDVVSDVNPTGKPSTTKGTSSPEKSKQVANTSDESESEKGLVKRNTLVYEGVLPFVDDDMTKDSNEETDVNTKPEKETESTVDKVHHSGEKDDRDGESCSGTVKRNTLIFEGRYPLEVEPISKSSVESAPDTVTDSDQLEVPVDSSENDEPTAEKDAHDAVDTSSVVNVKLHLKLLEEVIRKANERETHKQRTTKALADLEDKRKQIEMEQNKLDIENAKEHDLKNDSDNAKDDISTDCGTHGETSSPEENPENESQDDSISDVTPCVGNVRIRTLQLEERIQGQPLRRHGSMPRTTRTIDRPVIRQRSMSDLQVGNRPSTSRDPISSSSSFVREGHAKKNKEEETSHQGELPDNDRDSEKLSDNMSEKSDKTDEDLKSEDIFQLQGRTIDLSTSKPTSQMQDQDNKAKNTYNLN